jgi:hypothetical protein
MVFAVIFTAAPAQAASWDGPTWQRIPTITVSDRNGYDLNENEATYATSSLSSDDLDMAYTQLETCTYCIKIYAGTVSNGVVRVTKSTYLGVDGVTYTRACTINIDVAEIGSDWHKRQAASTGGIWGCLGFGYDPAGDSIMNPYNYTHVNAWTPSSSDYSSLDYHYSNPWK